METVGATKDHLTAIERDLLTELDNLRHKRELLDCSQNNELHTVWMMDDWNSAESLRRKEKDLIFYRKERASLEVKIVNLYLKSMAMMHSKLNTFLKRLASQDFTPNAVCPADFTVSAYREWCKHDPKLVAIHSEILELLTEKVKLAQDLLMKEEKVDIPRSFTNDSDKDGPMNFEKLRKRAYTMVNTAPHLDSSFSEFVSELISPTSDTFEGRRTRDYVSSCWEYFGKKDLIELPSDTEATDPLSPCSPDGYQMFLCAMTQFLVNRYSQLSSIVTADGVNPGDLVYKVVETTLFPQISDCIYKTISCQAADKSIELKYKSLGHVTQAMLGIKPEHIKVDPCAYGKAISMLKSTLLSTTPNQKLRRVILAAQHVMEEMNKSCQQDGMVAGADEFMDIWVYVVLKARVSNLATVVCLLRNYCNPNLMMSEAGYYISSLEFAYEYIKSMESKDLPHVSTKHVAKVEVHEMKYVVVDIDKMRQLAQKEQCPFTIVSEEVVLHDYEPVLLVDWYNDRFRVLQRLAFPNEHFSTHACIIQPKFGLFKDAQHFESFLCSYQKNVPFIQFVDCADGKLPVLVTSLMTESRFCLFHSPQCSLKSLNTKLQHLCSLKGLGSAVLELNTPTLLIDSSSIEVICTEWENNFCKNFGITDQAVMANKISGVIKEVEEMLHTLGYYTGMLPFSELYDCYLKSCVSEFQKSYNSHQQSATSLLNEDGTCDFDTYSAIKNSIQLLSLQCMSSF